MNFVTSLAYLAAINAINTMAMTANPNSFQVLQSSGEQITLYIKGDEVSSFLVDVNNNVVKGYKRNCPGGSAIEQRHCMDYKIQIVNEDCSLTDTDIRAGVEYSYFLNSKKTLGGVSYTNCIDRWLKSKSVSHLDLNAENKHSFHSILRAMPVGNTHSRTRRDLSGKINNLVIMIRWADHLNRVLPVVQDYNNMMNDVKNNVTHYPSGSLKTVYLENSYGKLDINSVFTDWIDVDMTESEAANDCSGADQFPCSTKLYEAMKQGLVKAEEIMTRKGFDFKTAFDKNDDGNIDMVTFLHSGHGAETGAVECQKDGGALQVDRIWSHKGNFIASKVPGRVDFSSLRLDPWNSKSNVNVTLYHISPGVWGSCGSIMGRLGTVAHELGHYLGLLDTYDTTGQIGSGTGSFDLMGNSWGLNNDQLCFPQMSALNKIILEWLQEEDIQNVNTTGTYYLRQVQNNKDVAHIQRGFSTEMEFFLIENRQPIGSEYCIKQGGLLIHHIDLSTTQNKQVDEFKQFDLHIDHYRYSVVQADGRFDIETGANRGDLSDLWSPLTQTSFTPLTVPNTNGYRGGKLIDSHIYINNISKSSKTMSFHIDWIEHAEDNCVTVRAGDACYDDVMWAMESGIYQHPEWYTGLTSRSSFEDFQRALFKKGRCEKIPCA
eukprot:Pgem_evm1s17695